MRVVRGTSVSNGYVMHHKRRNYEQETRHRPGGITGVSLFLGVTGRGQAVALFRTVVRAAVLRKIVPYSNLQDNTHAHPYFQKIVFLPR